MIEFDVASWENTSSLQDGEFRKLPADGYVCMVTNASVEKSQKGTLQLVLTLDIAEGEYAQMFKDGNHAPRYFKAIYTKNSNKISPYFKGLITNFINSNTDFIFNGGKFNERSLIGKKIGMVFRDEQREWQGRIYTDAKPFFAINADKIRNGEFTVPPMKTVEIARDNSLDDDFIGTAIPDEKVPF